MPEPIIAIIFDCDDTLSEDTTTFVLKQFGIDPNTFWADVTKMVEKERWDPQMAYMNQIVEYVQKERMLDLTQRKLIEIGQNLPLFPGLPEMFQELPTFVKRIKEFKEARITLEFYIITGGLEEVVSGSRLAEYMHAIFGCNFHYDSKTKLPVAVKYTISFTEKTKFVFAINKGISERMLRKTPYRVNDTIPPERRRIPFSNMIYIGDGPSDIPCFSLIKREGGQGIGVFRKPRKGYELARGNRITVGPYSADYRKGTDMRKILEETIKDIGYNIVVRSKQGIISAPTHS